MWSTQASNYDLEYDAATDEHKEERRLYAGCGRNNRCSYVAGTNCDEFPFASSKEADFGEKLSRCVTTIQNNIHRRCSRTWQQSIETWYNTKRANSMLYLAEWSQGHVIGAFLHTSIANGGCGDTAGCQYKLVYDYPLGQVPVGGYCSVDATNWQQICVNTARGPHNQQEILASESPDQPGLLNLNPAPDPTFFLKRAVNQSSSIDGETMRGPRVFHYRLASGRHAVTRVPLEIGTKTLSFAPRQKRWIDGPRAMFRRYTDMFARGTNGSGDDDTDYEAAANMEAMHDMIVGML